MRVIFAVLVATCNLVAVKSAMSFRNIFPNIIRCRHNQILLNQCIQQNLKAMQPYLARGIPQLNIFPHNPYYIDKRTVRMKDAIFNGTATFTNIWIYGLTEYEIYEVEYFGPSLEMRIDVIFPNIEFFAYYDINGVLFHTPIKKRVHPMSITCKDVRAFITLRGTRYIKDDRLIYFKVETVPVDLHVREAKIRLHNLEDSLDRTLRLNEYLNKMFETNYIEIMINVGYFASEIIKTTADKISWNFPLTTLLF